MAKQHPGEALDVATATGDVCARYDNDPAALLEILHDLQDEVGYIPQTALSGIAKALNISRAEVHGVVSFYHDFRDSSGSTVTVKLCRAESCQSMGAVELIERICCRHGIALGETSADGELTIEPVYCLGNCALSPAALVNGRPLGRVTEERLDRAIREART